MSEVIQALPERFAGAQNVGFSQWRGVAAALSKQVSAEQSSGRIIHEIPAVPAVWQMRRIKPAQRMAAQTQHFAILNDTSRAVGNIVNGSHRGYPAADRDSGR